MAIILNLALCFGGNGFYQYHTHFASKAAACLYQFNEDTYWCTLNNEIYCRIFAPQAALLCSLCHASSHPASFCAIPVHVKPQPIKIRASAFYRLSTVAPQAPIPPKPVSSAPSAIFSVTSGIDQKYRPIIHQGGCTIYNNFNDSGFNMSQFRFLHVCSFCGVGYARPVCPHNRTLQNLSKHLSTPINIPAALLNHPNPAFVQFLIKGVKEVFHLGISVQPSFSLE